MLDTMSTLIAMASFAGLSDENGQFPGQEAAFMIDSIGTSVGALLGTSPVTTYIEVRRIVHLDPAFTPRS
jgi:AGZA family xanthine/uracil permease-like MFS transporter